MSRSTGSVRVYRIVVARLNAISPGPISTPLYGKLGLSKDDLTSLAGFH
jgi:hypothetical protein